MGAILPSPMAMLVAMVVLPTPPLGEKTPITRPLGPSGSCRRCGPVLAGEGLAGALQQDPDLGRLRRRAEDVPDAGPHGQQHEVRVRLADQDDAELGKLDVEDRGQPQGVLQRHVRPKDQHLGAFLVKVREQFRRGRTGSTKAKVCRPPGQTAGQGLADAGIEVGVGRDQDEAAHL